jgi:hypothetical protein
MNDLLRIRRPRLLAIFNETGPSYCSLSACFSNRDNRYPSVEQMISVAQSERN